MTAKRFADALFIVNPGACNPSGIAHSFIEACQEARAEGADTAALRRDPALRLMVYQLAFLMGGREADEQSYSEAVKACEAKRDAEAVKPRISPVDGQYFPRRGVMSANEGAE